MTEREDFDRALALLDANEPSFEELPLIVQLAAVIERAGLRMTLDPERGTNKPCFICGTSEAPRELLIAGHFICDAPGNHIRGDEVERPVCPTCAEELGLEKRRRGG